MSQYVKNEKLIIQTFPNSLTSLEAIWFVHLDKTEIISSEDRASAFITHYKLNIEISSHWFHLNKESMKSKEIMSRNKQNTVHKSTIHQETESN